MSEAMPSLSRHLWLSAATVSADGVASLSTMDPSPAQRDKVSYLRRVFGAKVIKPHSPDRTTGTMRVEVTCEAGVWEWFFDPNGILIDSALVGRLFDMPPPTPRPRSAVDN